LGGREELMDAALLRGGVGAAQLRGKWDIASGAPEALPFPTAKDSRAE